ncbi:MAG: S-layer homology domain-containing protein, partial [Candidatus Eremiobacteraeota bacterium]|nr:S-layer homology domain-containing protein [Candidatus Eremiobacteraeota bacterium]
MKRLARLATVVGLTTALLTPLVRQAAVATPFSDVPANHWAYQYIQSLAADGIIDGYPDGKFKGDRPLTRYEMAVVVARVIAKLQENEGKAPSKEDLDKLQKLIDALKDELDALGVRVTNLEDSLDALDKRTKFAQSLSMHGVFLPNLTFRQRPGIPTSVVNTTGESVSTYYGGTAANGGVAGAGGGTSNDPFLIAFLSSDDSNNPLTQAGSGIQIRQDSRFSLAYQINDNLTISLPVHVLNFEYGGEFSEQSKIDLEPGVDINIARAGAISNLDFKFGIIDNMTSSRTGLAFRAPQGYSGAVPYEEPIQPFQKGAAVKGTIAEGAFGTTDFEASFTRMDQTLLDTQTGVTDPTTLPLNANTYFFPVVPPQEGYVQSGAAQALTTNTFNANNGTLGQVYLSQKAVDGSVYVSYYNGATFNNAGVQTGGPATALPGFSYNDAYNNVVFTVPLPAGSVVGITYRGLTTTNNTNFQRYMTHARFNQKFKGYEGLEIGVTFNRIFDFDDIIATGTGGTSITQDFQGVLAGTTPSSGNGLVSDTVLGIDFQAPIPYDISGPGSKPILFGEAADSKFTADYRNVPAVGDTAGLVGLRFKIQKVEFSAQYQSVGINFMDGAPFKYYGNPPPLFAFYRLNYLPDFIGFGNNTGINQQFDNQF